MGGKIYDVVWVSIVSIPHVASACMLLVHIEVWLPSIRMSVRVVLPSPPYKYDVSSKQSKVQADKEAWRSIVYEVLSIYIPYTLHLTL